MFIVKNMIKHTPTLFLKKKPFFDFWVIIISTCMPWTLENKLSLSLLTFSFTLYLMFVMVDFFPADWWCFRNRSIYPIWANNPTFKLIVTRKITKDDICSLKVSMTVVNIVNEFNNVTKSVSVKLLLILNNYRIL